MLFLFLNGAWERLIRLALLVCIIYWSQDFWVLKSPNFKQAHLASFVSCSKASRSTLPNVPPPLLWRSRLAVSQKHVRLPSVVPPPPPALSLPPLGDCRWASGQWHTVTRVSPQALCMVFNQVEAGGPLDCIDPEGWSIGVLSLCNFTPLKLPPFKVVLLAHSPHV